MKEASSRDRPTTREALIADGWEPCDFCGRPIKPGYENAHAETCRRRQQALRDSDPSQAAHVTGSKIPPK